MAVVQLDVSNTKKEGFLFKWTTQSKGFAFARDSTYGSGHNEKTDLGVGTYWNTNTNRVFVWRSFIQFTVPSGTNTSGKNATLKLYGRSTALAETSGQQIAGTMTEDVTVPDIQIFACNSIPIFSSSRRYIYSSFTSTTYSSQVTGISESEGWLEITLNSDALTAITSAAGSTFDLCIREFAHDVGNSDPGISGGASYFWQFASMKDTEFKPRIIIADAGFNHNLLGIAKTSISKVNDTSMASPQDIERINDVQ